MSTRRSRSFLRRIVIGGVALSTTAAGLAGAGAVPEAEAATTFRVTTVVSGLTIPWDLTWVGSTMLFDTRDGKVYSKRGSAAEKRVSMSNPGLFVKSEGGLLGIVADPKASTNKRFYTCQATKNANGSARDVRVLRWKLTSATKAVKVGRPLVTGIPLSSGRHSGCRLRFGPGGRLLIGTGDAAQGANPQNLQSLGGKVLRVNADGSIPKTNPFYSRGGKARYVLTYGHRNVQGLAIRPGNHQVWSVEQGTYRDDEANLIAKGKNYGYDPVPGYNESVPMTDRSKFPRAVPAKWSSGSSTIATSGASFVSGRSWGRWNGALAIGVLKGEQIRLLKIDSHSRVVDQRTIPGLDRGRIRTVQRGPDGALYFTTSNGNGRDIIGKITASS